MMISKEKVNVGWLVCGMNKKLTNNTQINIMKFLS